MSLNIRITMKSVRWKNIKTIGFALIITSVLCNNGHAQSFTSIFQNLGIIQQDSTQHILGAYLYQYQNIDQYPQLDQLYIAEYIQYSVEKEALFESLLFPSLKDYTIETYKYDPLFRLPKYTKIRYVPNNFHRKAIDDYQDLMHSNKHSKQYEAVFENLHPIAEAKQKFIFSHPHLINQSWDSIPEAPVLGRDGYLKRRSASEGISRLLRDNTYDTRPSLEKVTFSRGPWVFTGTENVQLSQGYVDNWVKGGESSVTLSSDLRLNANYKKGKHEWENYIIHKVGVISTENDKGRVNTDLIEINTKYGHKASEKWYYSFLYNFKTQFFYGYDNSDDEKIEPVSGFMAPAYMSFAIGMDFKPSSKFTLLISPITARITSVSDTIKYDQNKFGIPDGKSHLTVNGISVVNNFEYQISREIKLSSRFDAFYQYIGKVEKGTTRQVQLDWEVILDMRINRFLSTRFLAHARYFTNESEKLQFREDFNISFRYNF